VDDLNISFSDEEMQEGIMNPASRPKKEYKGQGIINIRHMPV
jgi:hypothetical protein